MNNIKIIDTTSENIHLFGMCGYKNTKNQGYRNKLDWTRKRFAEGMRYKMLVSDEKGAIGGIEYIPGEHAWRPVEAEGFMFIHCIFILPKDAKGKGYGQQLVQACIDDARRHNMKGVAVITRKGTWMAGKELFLKMGFVVADHAKPDFELLALKFDKRVPDPSFRKDQEDQRKKYTDGLYLITSDQCPYAWKAVTEISEAAEKDYQLRPQTVRIENSEQAREVPFPFGTFGIIYNGKVVADHPVSQTRFRNIMNKELKR